MIKPNLTTAQTTVLVMLYKHKNPASASELHTSVNTVEAMVKKGLLEKISPKEVVWSGLNRISYTYKLTDLGRSMIR